MKSSATKKRLAMEAEKLAQVRESREQNPYLMSLYESFIPDYKQRGVPKFMDDRYGNRVRTESISV